MCDLATTVYLTLISPALILLCAEYAAHKLPLVCSEAWFIGTCIGILISAIFSFFILPSLLFAGLLCTGAAGY